jgi:hypothetical protein
LSPTSSEPLNPNAGILKVVFHGRLHAAQKLAFPLSDQLPTICAGGAFIPDYSAQPF